MKHTALFLSLCVVFAATTASADTFIESKRLSQFKQAGLIAGIPSIVNVVEYGDAEIVTEIIGDMQDQILYPVFEVINRRAMLLTSLSDPDALRDLARDINGGDRHLTQMFSDAMEGIPLTSLAFLGGKLLMFSTAPIGDIDAPAGVLILGTYFDDDFAKQINRLSGTDVSFMSAEKIIGSSLDTEARSELSELLQQNEPSLGNTDDYSLETDQYMLRVKPMTNFDGEPIGRIVTQFSLAKPEIVVRKIQFLVLAIGVIILLVSIGAAYFLARSIVEPIKEMV
ncbi:MAG: hypothetical protein IH895_02885, partial [Planctomycetes bacterium]|nr:hypothetical protein [Planctomycetota bacterium]